MWHLFCARCFSKCFTLSPHPDSSSPITALWDSIAISIWPGDRHFFKYKPRRKLKQEIGYPVSASLNFSWRYRGNEVTFPEPSDQEPPAGSWTHSWESSRRRGSRWQRRPQGRREGEIPWPLPSPPLSVAKPSWHRGAWAGLSVGETGEQGEDLKTKTGTVGAVRFPKEDPGPRKIKSPPGVTQSPYPSSNLCP